MYSLLFCSIKPGAVPRWCRTRAEIRRRRRRPVLPRQKGRGVGANFFGRRPPRCPLTDGRRRFQPPLHTERTFSAFDCALGRKTPPKTPPAPLHAPHQVQPYRESPQHTFAQGRIRPNGTLCGRFFFRWVYLTCFVLHNDMHCWAVHVLVYTLSSTKHFPPNQRLECGVRAIFLHLHTRHDSPLFSGRFLGGGP